jgi:hypothetical protein
MRIQTRIIALALITAICIVVVVAQTQPDPNIKATSVIGEVAATDVAAKQITVKTDAGNVVTVKLTDTTTYLQIPPGEKSLDKATKIAITDLGAGDRVFARGPVSTDQKSATATSIVVMTKGDIAKKQQAERADWQRRGISGTISAINGLTKEITVLARTRTGSVPIIVPASGANVHYRRYAPDSVKFAEAKQSSFFELAVGDQIRALGQKSEDGTHYTPDEIVSGSFRTIVGTVSAVKAETGELSVKDLQTNKTLIVVISKDSVLKRLPPQMAMLLGGGARPEGMGGGRQNNGAAPAARPASTEGNSQGAPVGATRGGQMQGPPRMGGGSGDLSDMIAGLPPLSVKDMKAGDVIVFLSTNGTTANRATAITLVAGLEALLQQAIAGAQRGAGQGAGLGLPQGALDLGMGIP